mmetsp:Transcript_113408/g.366409  ORF Transcript_113408/g.366409 Transcript_113408/m.366409 type:complete len:300 (+) Transcript_113408:386-1285(+)
MWQLLLGGPRHPQRASDELLGHCMAFELQSLVQCLEQCRRASQLPPSPLLAYAGSQGPPRPLPAQEVLELDARRAVAASGARRGPRGGLQEAYELQGLDDAAREARRGRAQRRDLAAEGGQLAMRAELRLAGLLLRAPAPLGELHLGGLEPPAVAAEAGSQVAAALSRRRAGLGDLALGGPLAKLRAQLAGVMGCARLQLHEARAKLRHLPQHARLQAPEGMGAGPRGLCDHTLRLRALGLQGPTEVDARGVPSRHGLLQVLHLMSESGTHICDAPLQGGNRVAKGKLPLCAQALCLLA